MSGSVDAHRGVGPFHRLRERAKLPAVVLGLLLAPAVQTSAPHPDLSAAKRAARIADCPTTDASPAKRGLADVGLGCLGG